MDTTLAVSTGSDRKASPSAHNEIDQPMLSNSALGELSSGGGRLERSQTVLCWLLLINTIGPGMSVPLYWFIPHGTVGFFGGDDKSDSAAFWCQIVGAGDFMFAFICAAALFTRSGAVRQLVIRAIGWYSVFHFGGFLRGTWQPGAFPAMPTSFVVGVSLMFFGSQAMHIYYGYFTAQRALNFDARIALPFLRWCSPAAPTSANG